MPITIQRLTASLDQMAQYGATLNGGVTRLALTDEDKRARDLLGAWMEDARLAVRIDDAGNMIGRREGSTDAPPLLIGSHLDTVPQGGRFDGALGVLTGLEVIRALNDEGATTRLPIELINWTGEEGARFQPPLLGSTTALGFRDIATADAVTDRDGVRFGDELERIGYRGDAANRPADATAYLELHIEQGPVLEEMNLPVGAVLGIIGQIWHAVTIRGRAGHAGATPMPIRHDALATAAELITGVRELALRAEEYAVATVGHIRVEPDAMNVIPALAELSVDIRAASNADLDRIESGLHRLGREIGQRHGVLVDISDHGEAASMPFDDDVIRAITTAIAGQGIPVHAMWSGPGHDAHPAAQRWPTGMIFVRSRDGLSHAEAEYSSPGDIEIGARTLLRVVRDLAG